MKVVDVSVLQEARDYAEKKGLMFLETSAKTALNVEELFRNIGLYTQ